MTIIVAGYYSEEAFNANAQPIEFWKKTYSYGDMPFDPNNIQPNTPAYFLFGQSYNLVMTDEFFEGAIPV